MFFIYCGVINTHTSIYRTIHNKYPYVYIHISFLASTLYSLRPSSKMPTSTASTKTSTASTVVLKQDSWSSSISMTSANVASLIMPWHQQNKQNKACLTGAGPWSVLDIDNTTKNTQQAFLGENGETGYPLVTEIPSSIKVKIQLQFRDTFGIGSHKLWSKKIGNNAPERSRCVFEKKHHRPSCEKRW